MKLGTQTHFGQGWNKLLLGVSDKLGADILRDSIPWAQVESKRGVYDFSLAKVTWLDSALAQGRNVSLTFAQANPLYDGGSTVYTDAGRKAFAQFIVATLKRYPNITAIEIGNEYNSNSFVTGPIAKARADQRDDYYAKLVAAVDQALTAAHIDVEIVGGSTHSIPVDYFADLAANGALAHLDAVSIHPYTTPPEQFEDQIALLRGVIGPDMPIRVTEFGANFASLADAPAYLAKMVSVMGAAGVESASWYALAKQPWFPNMELWDQTAGVATPAGKTFALFDALLSDNAAITRMASDDFTYFYSFGQHAAVLWGQPRSVTLASGVQAFDLAGNLIPGSVLMLSPDVPVILRSVGAITEHSAEFAATTLVADSSDQFDVTNDPGSFAGFEGPWSYFAQSGTGKIVPLYTMGGGMRAGEPWTPYLGATWLRPLEVNATTVTPADFANGTKPSAHYAVVERYTAQATGNYTLNGHYDVADASKDGVIVSVRVNGQVIYTQRVFDKASGHVLDFELQHIALDQGDTVDFVVDSGKTAAGDATARSIHIYLEPATQKAPAMPIAAADGELAKDTGTGLDFSAQALPVVADLALGKVLVGHRASTTQANDVVGSGGADVLRGNGETNVLDGGAGNDRLFGGGGDDDLRGGAGNDTLDGGAGADRMAGGSGDDRYVVDNAGDRIIEEPGAGNDVVRASVDYALEDNLERLILTGRGAINGTGNALDNVIRGNGADNWLSGGRGDDRLTGGAGADVFVLDDASGHDVIMDFGNGHDVLAISKDAFAALQGFDTGPLAHLAFDGPGSAGHVLYFDRATSVLYYDADGAGSGEATAVLTFANGAMLTAQDITLL